MASGQYARHVDVLPRELETAFLSAPEAQRSFELLPPEVRREYVVWIREGRSRPTRDRRAAQAIMRLLATGGPS